jgi:hypothetical protein
VNLLKKLQNPFALVLQGFLVGGVLFWTTQGQAAPAAGRARPPLRSSPRADSPADRLKAIGGRFIAGPWFAFRSPTTT